MISIIQPSHLKERLQITSSSQGGGGLEKMTQDDGGGWRAKDDVTFLYDFSGENFNLI